MLAILLTDNFNLWFPSIMLDKRRFQLFAGESDSHQILGVSGAMRSLLNRQEFVGLTQQYGSEVIPMPEEDAVRITPPLPPELIIQYGKALIKLAQGFEPLAEIEFIDSASEPSDAAELRPTEVGDWPEDPPLV